MAAAQEGSSVMLLPLSDNSAMTAQEEAGMLLRAFYTRHNPEKLDEISTILSKYVGKEHKLVSNLMKKYNTDKSMLMEMFPGHKFLYLNAPGASTTSTSIENTTQNISSGKSHAFDSHYKASLSLTAKSQEVDTIQDSNTTGVSEEKNNKDVSDNEDESFNMNAKLGYLHEHATQIIDDLEKENLQLIHSNKKLHARVRELEAALPRLRSSPLDASSQKVRDIVDKYGTSSILSTNKVYEGISTSIVNSLSSFSLSQKPSIESLEASIHSLQKELEESKENAYQIKIERDDMYLKLCDVLKLNERLKGQVSTLTVKAFDKHIDQVHSHRSDEDEKAKCKEASLSNYINELESLSAKIVRSVSKVVMKSLSLKSSDNVIQGESEQVSIALAGMMMDQESEKGNDAIVDNALLPSVVEEDNSREEDESDEHANTNTNTNKSSNREDSVTSTDSNSVGSLSSHCGSHNEEDLNYLKVKVTALSNGIDLLHASYLASQVELRISHREQYLAEDKALSLTKQIETIMNANGDSSITIDEQYNDPINENQNDAMDETNSGNGSTGNSAHSTNNNSSNDQILHEDDEEYSYHDTNGNQMLTSSSSVDFFELKTMLRKEREMNNLLEGELETIVEERDSLKEKLEIVETTKEDVIRVCRRQSASAEARALESLKDLRQYKESVKQSFQNKEETINTLKHQLESIKGEMESEQRREAYSEMNKLKKQLMDQKKLIESKNHEIIFLQKQVIDAADYIDELVKNQGRPDQKLLVKKTPKK